MCNCTPKNKRAVRRPNVETALTLPTESTVAKAKPKATTQILLKDALARVVAEVQVPHYAQQLIVRWIAKGQLPWGQKTWDGYCWRGKSPEEMIWDLD